MRIQVVACNMADQVTSLGALALLGPRPLAMRPGGISLRVRRCTCVCRTCRRTSIVGLVHLKELCRVFGRCRMARGVLRVLR